MELTAKDWAKAEAIARELAHDVDRNELGKIVSYARRSRDVGRVIELARGLPASGYVRSGRTRSYLTRIADTLQNNLAGITDGEQALAILAWAFRLMTTYQTELGTRKAQGRKSKRSG
ncbi:MAG: hypothetical protein D6784_17640 [Chloroflexi bacterium]|nr:MAG: hypothetical protein D6784_17640 [Chloroflexota bacterium]